MPVFRYEALDAAGRLMRGAMEAASQQAVESRLRGMGFTPSAIAPADASAQDTARKPAPPGPAYRTPSLSVGDQALFWRQLAELSRAGISPFDSFQSLGSRTRNPRIRRAALDVADRIRGGSSVADAMAANERVFGTYYRVAVLAGELGGFVSEVYADLAAGLEEEKEHRERWKWWRWFYNANLIGTLVIIHFLAVVLGYISVHKKGLEPLSDDWQKLLVAAVAAWPPAFLTKALPAGLGAYLLYLVLMWFFEYGGGRRLADILVLSVPLVSRFKRIVLLRRFYRMLRRLLSGGVTPVVAWDAAASAVGNYSMASRLSQGRGALMTGAGFGGAFQATGVIPDADQQMITTGERAGRVPEMLLQMERDYEARYQSSSRLVRTAALLPGAIAVGVATVLAVRMIAMGYFNFIFDYTGF